MAYETLIAAWNGATQPPAGVTGTAITGGMTTAQKIAAVNTWTLSTPAKAVLPVTSVINAIVSADFLALTALQLQQMQFVLQGGATVDASPGTTVRAVFSSIFASKPTTLANLTALVAPYDNKTTKWTVANGYSDPLGAADVTAAGLS